MKTSKALACLVVVLGFLVPQSLVAATVSGTVQIADGKTISDIVVYLESAVDVSSSAPLKTRHVSQNGRSFHPAASS